jgi:hypothetical protein
MPVITRTAWVDDDGSGLTGTVINNAEKTTLYNQIDAVIAAIFTTGAEFDSPLHIEGVDPGLHIHGEGGTTETYVAMFDLDSTAVEQKTGVFAVAWCDDTHADGYAKANVHATRMIAGVQTDTYAWVYYAGAGSEGGMNVFPPDELTASAPGEDILNVFGEVRSRRDGLGTTSTNGVSLINTTAAAAGSQQYSPRLRFGGRGWKTDATAGSQEIYVDAELRPVQGTSQPTGLLAFTHENGSGVRTDFFVVTTAGVLSGINNVVFTSGDQTVAGVKTYTGRQAFSGSVSPAAGASVAGAAFYSAPTIIEAGSGTHALLAANYFDVPAITGGAALVTDAATVYIAGPTGATVAGKDYALWVDAGRVRIDVTTQTTVGAAGGASALPATPTGYAQINIGGTDFVMPYYAAA